jgi:predicted SnoaL-like aldol condensation-catalyzing enzyme
MELTKEIFVEFRQRKLVNIRSADLYKIENGIIRGHWDVVDQLNFLKQTRTLLSGPVG